MKEGWKRAGMLSMILMKACLSLLCAITACSVSATPLNIVLITADDMNWDSLGCTGGTVPDITPHIDRLATEGMLFLEAHATVPVCQPVRATMHTGLYPNRSGARGFGPLRDDARTINEVMHENGYLISMLAKVPHYQPIERYHVDYLVSANDLHVGRCPERFAEHTGKFLEIAKEREKPFFHHVNGQDPHRPFLWRNESRQPTSQEGAFPGVTRVIRPDEVEVPGFLENIPEVRQEVADYYTCVHRFDQLVGRVLAELDAAGVADSTLVMLFAGDNGMAFPFAKSNLHAAGTRGALIMRWPGKIPAGRVDREHLVSSIDFAPTLLEAAGLPALEGIDGRSFLEIAKGGRQDGRDRVITVYHETFSRLQLETRCVRTREAAYIWNAWSNGETQYRAENMSGKSWRAMLKAGETNPAIRARCEYYIYRAPEEFFLVSDDADERANRINDAESAATIATMRRDLAEWMEKHEDPLLEDFRTRVLGVEDPS